MTGALAGTLGTAVLPVGIIVAGENLKIAEHFVSVLFPVASLVRKEIP
jgi:hypothetical protein